MTVQTAASTRALDLEAGRLDFTGFGGLVSAYQVGSNGVVVETTERREIRITARRDLSNGAYVAEFERRRVMSVEGSGVPLWTRTTAYPPCAADDLVACLEAAMLEVSRAPGI